MIKIMKGIKNLFLFIFVFLFVTFSFACDNENEEIVLETPVVTISENGLASWKKVENATSYMIILNNQQAQEVFELEVQLVDGDTISVMAVSSDTKYKNSEYSKPTKFEKGGIVIILKLVTPVLTIDDNGLVKWEKVEGASSYNISINGSSEYINVNKSEYQLKDLEEIAVCAVSESENYTNSDFSNSLKYIKTTGKGTKENPYTVVDAIKLVNNKYNNGEISEEEFYFFGNVSGIPTSSEDKNVVRFDLSSDNGEKISAFEIALNENIVKANSKVVVLAKLQNYNKTTPELVNGKIISSENVEVKIENKSIKELLELGVSDVQYQISGTVKNIVSDLYGNFDLVDGDNKVYVYGLLTAELESKKFASLNINEGDKLTIIGNLSEYNGSLQIKNAVFVNVEKTDAKITVEKCENGTISEIDTLVKNGTKVVFTVKANDGYIIKGVYANGKLLEQVSENSYEFIVNGDTIVKAEFVKQGTVLDVTKKYVFSEFAAGEQYAIDEVHNLDGNVSVSTTEAHFTKELRLYSSSTHDGFAIFTLSDKTKSFKGLVINAGYKATNLGVYGSNDGKNYELIGNIAVSTSYQDYTVDFKDKFYQYIKLDPSLNDQVRVKEITITYGEPKKHEHEYSSSWNYDKENHYHECSCGEKSEIGLHEFAWIIDKEPTNEETGLKHEECSVCHLKKNEGTVIQSLSHVHDWKEASCDEAKKCKTCGEIEGAPLGHDYDYVNINWSWFAYSSATAIVSCKRDSSHVFTMKAKIYSYESKKATCAEYGNIMHSARITLNGIDYADIKVSNTPKTTDHHYEDGECIICHKILTTPIYSKVTNINQLNEGDKIILVSERENAVAIAMGSRTFLNANEYSSTVIDGNPIIITLSKNNGSWVLTTSEGVIGTTEAKKMKINGGTTTWEISFDDDGNAIIASTDTEMGRILYNVRNPRFLNYTSDTNDSMLLPQIYKYTEAKCQHSFGSLNVKVPATCTKEGTKAYYTCSICHKNYDENGKLLKDLTIEKLAHSYENGECSVCHKIDPSVHNLDFENIVWTWTNFAKATATISCKDNDGAKEVINATITSESIKDSSCSEKGIKRYTASFVYDGVTYSNTKDEELALKEHDCDENVCKNCSTVLTENNILSALFSLEKNGSLKGTYKLTGVITKINTAYSTQFKNITVTIKVGDKEVECYRLKGDGVENLAICDEITVVGKLKDFNGKKEFDSNCTPSSIINAKHKFGTLIKGTDATHTSAGEKDHYHCEICNNDYDENKLLLDTIVIIAKGHDTFGENSWTINETEHYHMCSCGDKVDQNNHTFNWVVDTPATTANTGLKHEECETCKCKRNENTIIDKLTCNHVYDLENIVWTWTGFTSAKAKFICNLDSSHYEEINATSITSAITEEADCKKTGIKTYTASVVFSGATYKNTKNETLEKANHNFANGKCTVCKTEGSAFVKVTDVSNLVNGDKIILVCESKKTVASSFKSSYLSSATYSKYVDEAANINLITINANSSSGWILTCSDGIIESETSGNSLKIENTASSYWIISFDEEGNAVISTVAGSDTKYMKYNASSPRFTNYASGQNDIQIYKFTGTLCSHNYGTLITKVDATCKVEGVKAHYKCSICERYFDESKNEVSLADLTIEKTDHADTNNDGKCDTCLTPVTNNLVLDFTKKTAKHNAYADSWTYGDFTIYGAANNNGGWEFAKFGGKNATIATANPVYAETTNNVSFAVSKIEVKIIAGSLPEAGMSVTSWGVKVYDNKGNEIDTVLGGTIAKTAGTFNFTASTGKEWISGYKYRVFFDCENTSTRNGIVWVESITLYK